MNKKNNYMHKIEDITEAKNDLLQKGYKLGDKLSLFKVAELMAEWKHRKDLFKEMKHEKCDKCYEVFSKACIGCGDYIINKKEQ